MHFGIFIATINVFGYVAHIQSQEIRESETSRSLFAASDYFTIMVDVVPTRRTTSFCNNTNLHWRIIFSTLCILYFFDSLLFVSGYCNHDAVNDYYGCNAGQACIQGNAAWWYQGSCLTCSKGYYCEGGYHKFTTSNGSPALMEPCPINTYLATTGADDSTDCTDCATGTFSGTASTSTADCTDQCSVGKYKAESGTSCIDCPAGTYRASHGATSISDCAPCEAGKYSSIAGATTCSEKCASNTYSESTGATSSSVCLACATGKYSLTGSTSCASGCSYGTLLRYFARLRTIHGTMKH